MCIIEVFIEESRRGGEIEWLPGRKPRLEYEVTKSLSIVDELIGMGREDNW